MNGFGNGAAGDMFADQPSMVSYFNRIDTLTSQPENEAEFSKEITKKHWKAAGSSSRCSNRSCRKSFTLLERHHHCKKCGDLFCTGCLKYRRKLNQWAHFDPLQGRPYKVCKTCYEEGTIEDGAMRSLSEEFARLREEGLNQKAAAQKGGIRHRGEGWRKLMNFDQECQRLTEGFKQTVCTSKIYRTLHELKSMVTLPDWQKSSTWLQESTAGMCRNCCQSFQIVRKRHFCKLCGVALCTLCSTLDLLIYIPDSQIQAGSNGKVNAYHAEPRLAIIKIIGCPEKQPEVSLDLRVCTGCREEMITRQVQRHHGEETPSGLGMLAELSALHNKFSVAETNVDTQLRDYQEIVDSLENNSRSSSALTTSHSTTSLNGGTTGGAAPQSNMRTLAKAQEDLNDYLAQHVLLVQRLKRLKQETESQKRLLQNYIRAKCDFYLEHMSTFRRMKKKLAESSPPEVLECIQKIMDRNAIISAHLYLRQLVYETIHLCDKYELQEKSAQLLVSLEQEIERDVTACLQKEKEDVGQHLELMKEMIRTQMKEHKLIRPSRRSVKEHGRAHVQQIMLVRTRDILDQVTLQLRFKSANRNFSNTKQALEQTTKLLSAA
ncbi:uncharacterized protein [Littorina saxatilis]